MAEDRKPMANIAPFGLRMQPELKERIEAAAKANARSMNGEIVDRLQKSFEYEKIISDLRAEVAVAESLTISDTGLIQFRLTPKLVDMLEANAKSSNKSIGGEIRDMLRQSLEQADEGYEYEIHLLEQKIERQRVEIDRLRNQKFGGRAVRAEMDALQREREALNEDRKLIRKDVEEAVERSFERKLEQFRALLDDKREDKGK